MNLKSNTKTSPLFETPLNRKITCSYKSLSFLLVIFFVGLNLSASAFPKAWGELTFSTKIVKSFNERVIKEVNTSAAMVFAPCPGGSGVIGGKAFQDFNYNGIDDQIGGGIGGIEVYLYNCDASGNSTAAGNTTTDPDGTYFFSGLTDGTTYRVEFIVPTTMNFLQSGFNGTESRTTVQFVNSPSCGASIGLASPADFCDADPSLAIPCYVNGDPLASGSGSAGEEALVLFKSSYEGGNPKPTVLATAEEIGATWGIAYHRGTKTIYTSAFLKRHVGFGPLGIGGIYKTDLSGAQAVTTPFIDVNAIGINVGSYPSNSQRGLTANVNLPNNDPQAFDEVGKKGLGGMCMSEDGSKLYVVNITENKLHSINISSGGPTSSDVTSFNLPNPNCSGGEFRPFAVRMSGGSVYVGGVCDAEGSGNKSDLRSIVYRLDGNNFTEVLNFSLDYTKGKASRSCDDGGWFPWTNQIPETCFMSGNSQVIVHPTPHLTAIEFDDAGDLILGYTDRMGNQLGFINYGPSGTDITYSVFTGGEILKAGANQDGSFTIENNGSVNGVTTSGADNGEGPGGGEFYAWDVYDIGPNIPRPHSETAQGGLATIKGSGQVITTALDPFGTSVNSGGVNYFDNQTGEVRDPGYRVFRSGSSSPASFSKANGLGDLVALCGEAPIEIGGRLWLDENENGIQDPCEAPFSGVEVALYAMDGQVTEVVTSDANGEYYFNGSGATVPDIESNTDYYIVIGFGSQFDNFNNVLLDSFFLTTANTGMGQNPDLNDSDGMTTPGGILDGAFEGWPSISITTGNAGEVTHDHDAGFIIDTPDPQENITGFVWNDLNENGLQNNGELGIPGVTVSLFASNNTFIASTSTDADGNYIFENLAGKNYYLVFDASGDANVGDNFEVTLQDIGSDENLDSDISQSDSRVDFEFEPINGPVEFDAGFTLPVAQVVGFVFNDADEDGLQGNNETGISGVTVTLFNADGTEVASTTSDANGNYTFDNIMEGDYYVVVDVSSNTGGVPNFEGTQQDAGDDDFDSDVNPSTGQSEVFSHNPADGNSDVDAGFIEPAATITGFVWNDLNENGLQNDGENGIPGVTVNLLDGNGNQIETTTTDADGNYSFSDVKSDNYQLTFDASNDPIIGDNFEVTLQDIGSDERFDSDISQTSNDVSFVFDAAEGNADFDAGFTLPVAQVVGFIFNDADEDGLQGNNETGIGGVSVTLFDADGTEIATTTSDANGNYTFDNIMGGDFYVVVDVSSNTTGIPNFEGTQQDAGDDDFDSDVNPSTGQSDVFTHNPADGNSDVDAGFIEPAATITGFVWNDLNENGLQNDGENGISGVRVNLLDGNGNQIATTTTDANGDYSFADVKSDNYELTFDASNDPIVGDNFEVTLQDVGSDERFDSDIDQISNDVSFEFNAGEGNADFDAGFTLPLANIMGIAFDDVDKNGLQGGNEPMIGGVTVTLFDSNNNSIGTATTDANGNYAFNEIMAGSYYIAFDVSTNSAGIDNYLATIQDAGDDDFDSDADPNTGRTTTFNFNPSDGDELYDAGYFEGTGSITGSVFNDLNENGLQDPSEPGIGGVKVTVIAPDGTPINTSTSGEDGSFDVDGIPSGTVTVLFDPDDNSQGIENLTPTIKDVNNNQNDDIDSDINPNKEVDPIAFNAVVGADVDAGFFQPVDPVMIGNFVFKDCNENGVQDADEIGIPNVPVTLRGTDNLGTAVEMQMTTNSMGNYLFTASRPGIYFLDFDIPEGVTGLEFSPKNRGNSANDSDVNPLSGVTDAITLASGESNLTIDAGVIDNSPPLIFNVPPDVTVDCNDIPNPPSSVKGVDNCDPSIEVTFSERIVNAGSCPYMIERMWTAVDDCGNEAVRTQTVTVTDTEAPVITIANPMLVGIENGGEVIFNCDNLPEFTAEDVNATDNCSDVEVKFVDLVREQGDCEEDGFIVKMTCGWVAEDDCGNRSEFNIVIFVVDTKSPVLQNIPADLTINLDEGQFIPPVANTVTATDNCDEYVRVEFEETQSAGVCGYEIIRTWKGFDDCGNKVVESQKLTLLEDCTCPDELVSSTLAWDAACDGSVGGKIILDLTADINKYDITISPNVGNVNFSGNMFTDLPTGDYIVMVNYDAIEDCSETYNFTIATATPSTIEVVSQTQADCNTANGTVTLAPATNTYTWSDGGTGAQRNDLAAGSYIVTFTDVNNCQGAQAINITNPDGCECIDFSVNLLWEIMPTCNGYTNGQVDVEIIGGIAPFTYLWHDGQITKDLFGVTGGPYSLTVTDASGCMATLTGELEQPDAISVTETLMNGACGEKGAVDIFVSGGTAPYTYRWSSGETTEDLTNLTTGTYTITVTDANSCEGNLTVIISNSGDISIDLSSTNPSCGTEANGSITAMVTGGQNPLTYEWSNGVTTSSIDNVVGGTYAVMVTDATGCSAMAELTLEAPTDVNVSLTASSPECGVTTGNITLAVMGGTAPYIYAWNNSATTQNIDNLTEGNYEVTVTDANGCTGTAAASVSINSDITASATTQAPACDGENGSIILEVSGGRSAYTYAWNTGATTRDLMNVAPGNYSVVITDADGCSTTLSADIESISGLTISNTPSSPACVGDAGGSISVDISGGVAPYTYAWTNGASTKNIDNLTPGGYTLTAIDANGCIITTTAVLEAPTSLSIEAAATMPSCIGMVGSIDISINGGAGNYTYVWDFGAATEDVDGLLAGDYTVTVTDVNGCQITNTTTITVPTAIEATTAIVNPGCVGEGGQVDLTVAGGTAPYTYNWSNGATTKDLTDVAPGDYNVMITDVNGCTTTVNAMVGSTAGLAVTENISDATCAGVAGGSIDISVNGGTAPYTYNWTNGATTEDINDLMPGAYSVVITDANGCQLMGTYSLLAPNAIEVTTETDNPDCSDDTGKINITVSGGTAPYTFAWSNGATTEDLDDVLAGIYQGTITDANGCTFTASATLTAPSALSASFITADQDCSGDGNVDLTVSGGTAPYNYVWSNGATTEDLDRVGGGTYTVVISDANNCKLSEEVTVVSTGGIQILVSGTAPSCPGGSDGALNLNVQGGTLPYVYQWSNGSQAAGLVNIPAGSYMVTVTDAKGCSLVGPAVLDPAPAIEASVTAVNPVCADGSGSIDLVATGGVGNLTYLWTNGATTEDISDLTAGGYTVTITDSNGCTTTATTIISIPTALAITATSTNPGCDGTTGSITLSVAGGTAPYTYSWNNGSFEQNLTDITAGTYSVTIADANGCQGIADASIDNIDNISVAVADATNPTCVGNTDGFINLSVSGGTAPYTYNWTNGGTTKDISGLAAGAYAVTVSDARGCQVVADALLETSTIEANVTAVNPVCSDGTGSIDLVATGGTGTLTYLWTNGATTEDINGLTAGGYTVTITDANGCTTTATEVIVIPTALNITATSTNPGCDGSTGNISLSVAGGTAPYTYTWSNGSIEQNLNNVPAGTFTVTVTDANGCLATADASIDNIANISVAVDGSADPTCAGGADGFINLSVSGGMAPYTYLWTNGATTEDISGLTAGIYAVTIADARDCKIVLDAVLEAPAAISMDIKAANPDCPGGTGNINVTVMGGTPPYTYSWNNGATTQDLTNVAVGNYQLNVIDANGCTRLSENISIRNPDDFTVTLSPKDVRCYGETNGEIILTNSGVGIYTYAWSTGATTQNIANLDAGTYSVTVTNEKGCQKTAEAVVNIPPAISLGMTFSNPQCPSDLGAINIDVAGGTAPYTYVWSNGATTEDVTDLPAARYTVVVTDANGCTLEGSATIRPATEILASTVVTNQSCTTGDGAIDLSVSGGSGTYNYAWNTGATSQDLSGVTPGTYEVTITDTKGCFITQQAVIGDDCVCPSPLVNQNMVTNARCGEANGSLMIMVNGDVNAFQFQWTPNLGTVGANQNERINLPAGTYDVLVTYANKAECSEQIRLVVGNKDGVSGSVSSNVPATCDQNNGQVILTPGVSYIWPDGSQSQNRNDLAPGSYTIKTIDPSGCESSLIVTITQEPCGVTCTMEAMIASIKNPDCDGNLGSIDVSVAGGTAPYTYAWSLTTVGNNEDAGALAEGEYSVVVTDANGCNVSLTAILTKPDCVTPVDPDPTDPDPIPSGCNLSISLETVNPSCNFDHDGQITANILNGVAPFTYEWSNGATTQKIENLAPGDYWVRVSDGNGCRTNATIKVVAPDRLAVTETRTVLDCKGVEIKLNISGGRAPYKWECHGNTGTPLNPLNLVPGTYDCVVTDGSGCSINYELVIEDYQPLDVTGVVKNTTCGQEDGSIDLTVTGGTAPYTFDWDCGLYHDEDQFNLGTHTYNVTVTDATNCVALGTYTIEDCSGEGFGFIAVEAVSLGDQSVQLTWETENENRAGNYVVYHSTDGENFDVIGLSMEGKGPIEAAAYEMMEQGKFGVNYYQIKYLDIDGNEYFSDIINVVVQLSESTGRSSIPAIVYPNPTYDEFALDFAKPIDAVINVMITDMDGVVIEEVELQPGTSKHIFDSYKYDAGVYNITVQQRRKKLKTYRLIKAME